MVKYEGNIEAFNTYLADHSYVDGYTPSSADVEAFKAVGTAPDAQHAHALRWFNHIKFFSETERSAWGGSAVAAKGAAKEDDFDLFSDDSEADAAYEAEVQKRADEHIASKKAATEAAGKAPVQMKSIVVLDVKPWEDTTDLVEMEKLVRAIEMPGLEWKASSLKPIGYGIKKLQISCHIVDEIISVDDIQEKIQSFEDHVQSTDVVTFTKL